MTDRATIPEVLEFCNAVREAGGTYPLDALMPGTPKNAENCLIAKNLNFACQVRPIDEILDEEDSRIILDGEMWGMFVADPAIRERIAERLGLDIELTRTAFVGSDGLGEQACEDAIMLPERIWRVADDFDKAAECEPDHVMLEDLGLADVAEFIER